MAGIRGLIDITLDSSDSDDSDDSLEVLTTKEPELGGQPSTISESAETTATKMSAIELSDTPSESSSSDDDLPGEDDEVVITEGAELEAYTHAIAARRASKLAEVRESQQRKTATLKVDLNTVDAHFPLPKPPSRLMAHDHSYATYFHPLEAHQRWMEDAGYAQEYMARQPLRKKRQIEQRRRDGTDWSRKWSVEGYNKIGEGRQGACAAFFPYPEYAGLEALDGVFATVAGNVLELWQARGRKGSCNASSTEVRYDPAGVLIAHSLVGEYDSAHENGEDLQALAWSVNTSTWPFTPMLAVGGKGRAVHIFQVKIGPRDESVALCYDRTIVGHGGPITDLKFSPSHPHLLVSASVDRTARLLDPTVPRQSTSDTQASSSKGTQDKKSKKKAVAWHGETLGIFANDGHTKPVLSVDIHPRLPLVVTSGLDGKILLWTFPASLRGPTWPVEGDELYQHPPTPSGNVPPPPLFKAPIFSSTSIHDNWCDQVVFASHSSAHILSKAGRPSTDIVPVSGKEVKLWCPTLLDRTSYMPAPRSQVFDDDDPSATAHLLSQRASSFPDGPDRKPISSAFRVYRRIDLEDSNALQDRMGLHLLPLEAEDPSALLETVLFIPTANEPSLYAFRPFGPSPAPVPVTEGRQMSVAEEREARLEALMATGEDRGLYDMVPRLRPSAIVDVQQQKVGTWAATPAGRKGEMRLRCVAVQPNGAKWVVGVGDDGLMLLWRRSDET